MTDIGKICSYVKDSFKSKYKLLINGREKVGIKKLKNPKPFTDYSQTIYDVYKRLKGYNPTKKRKVLTVFDDMIADLESSKIKLILEESNTTLHLFSYHNLISKCAKLKC